MEWLVMAGLVLGTALAIIALARRAARPDEHVIDPNDPDPHAGTLREIAGQEGPRIWDP